MNNIGCIFPAHKILPFSRFPRYGSTTHRIGIGVGIFANGASSVEIRKLCICKLSHRSFAMLASDDSPGFDSDLSISAEIHHVC